jgi:hypothetical protein
MSMVPGKAHEASCFLSLGGLNSTALDHFASYWGGIKSVVFCLDSDAAADAAYERMGGRYALKGYRVSRHIPVLKDWNAQLLHMGHSFPAPPVPWVDPGFERGQVL